MKRIIQVALLAFGALGLRIVEGRAAAASKPVRPPNEYFVWADPGIASGNFDADYADCKAQIEKDPAISDATPSLPGSVPT